MGILGKGRYARANRCHRYLESVLTKAAAENLEIRCTPAASVMNLTSTGVLSYQAAAGDANFLEISINGSSFVFQDVGTGVTINATNVPGSVQLAPNSVSVPISSSVGSMFVNLSDMKDTIVLLDDILGRQISVHGGAGDDAIDLRKSTSLTVAFGEAGEDDVLTGQGGSFVLGGEGADSLVGGGGNDSLNGGAGDDTLDGGAGDDMLGELAASPYALPEIYGLLVYTGLDQPLDYVNQLVTFNRDNPSFVNIVGNNGINPDLFYGTGLDFDDSGNMYMTIQTNTDFLYKVDRATGAATLIGGSGIAPDYRVSDLSWDHVGNRMLATVDYRLRPPGPIPKPQLAEVDLVTGAVTILTTLNIDDNQTVALSVDTQGNYYVLGLYTARWYKIDRNSYAVTPLATLPFFPNDWQQGATIDWAHNDVLYYASFAELNSTTFTNTFYTVDKATGNLTTVAIMGLNIQPNGSTQYSDIAIDPLSDQGYLEPGNDSILGGDGNDSVRSGEGNDYASGGNGNDSIHGGAGDDTLVGDAGADRIEGEAGIDLIRGGADGDLLSGGDGDDFMDGSSGNDSILGGNGNDEVDGGSGDDLIAGMDGDDSIDGGVGVDSIQGGVGNDLLEGGDDADLIFGEEGNDTILGGNGDDLIYGGEGDDLIYGGTLTTANMIHMPRNSSLASDGNDTILGGNGFDRVDGGNGDNLLDAGDDGIRETVLAGPGNDMMYSHKYTESLNFDRSALDGGHNQVLCRGYLVQPNLPPPPADSKDFVAATIPIQYYTGQWLIHGRQLVEYPAVERVPGNRNGFTPPFRGAQPRTGARQPIRRGSQAKGKTRRNSLA